MTDFTQIEETKLPRKDGENAPKIPVNIPNGQIKKLAAVTGAVYAVRKNLRSMAQSPALKALGIVGDDGDVDVAGLTEVLEERIEDGGFTITAPILGDLKFFREDVERLKSYIEEGQA